MSDQSIFPEWRSFLGNSSDSEARGFLKSVVKRSGEIAEYDRSKIEAAIGKAIEAEEKRKDPDRASKLTDMVEEKLRLLLAGNRAHSIPGIEEIQDIVESVLIENKEVEKVECYSAECFVVDTDIEEHVAFDMELHSIAFICDEYEIPLYSLKKISDNLNIEHYYENVKQEDIFELHSSLDILKKENII